MASCCVQFCSAKCKLCSKLAGTLCAHSQVNCGKSCLMCGAYSVLSLSFVSEFCQDSDLSCGGLVFFVSLALATCQQIVGLVLWRFGFLGFFGFGFCGACFVEPGLVFFGFGCLSTLWDLSCGSGFLCLGRVSGRRWGQIEL